MELMLWMHAFTTRHDYFQGYQSKSAFILQRCSLAYFWLLSNWAKFLITMEWLAFQSTAVPHYFCSFLDSLVNPWLCAATVLRKTFTLPSPPLGRHRGFRPGFAGCRPEEPRVHAANQQAGYLGCAVDRLDVIVAYERDWGRETTFLSSVVDSYFSFLKSHLLHTGDQGAAVAGWDCRP